MVVWYVNVLPYEDKYIYCLYKYTWIYSCNRVYNPIETAYVFFPPQMVEKQKRSLADEKNAQSSIKKENQSLMSTCEDLQRKREKHEHELQTKDSRLACLEGQLAQTKRALEEETNKVNKCLILVISCCKKLAEMMMIPSRYLV